MKRSAAWTLAIFAAAVVAMAMPGAGIAQQMESVYREIAVLSPDRARPILSVADAAGR